MSRIDITIKSLIVPVLVVVLAACSAVSGRETAGEYLDDTTITTKVKSEFIGDPQIKAMQINVETMRGVVQLSGFVDSSKQKARAVQIARQVRGVQGVQDNIMIAPKGTKR